MEPIIYSEYNLSFGEKVLYFLLAFTVGALVGYLFYGGIGIDQYGNPTTTTYIANAIVCVLTGGVAAKIFLPLRRKQILNKRQQTLRIQFRDMLDALSTSLSAGNNVPDSFASAYNDLKMQYPESAFIVIELKKILAEMNNNINIENSLRDFGERSGIADVLDFSSIFEVGYRRGGDIKDMVANTHQIISDKMEVEQEIKTIINSSKLEQNAMSFMPVIIVGAIKLMMPDFGQNFASATGILSTTVAVAIFVGCYFLSRKITDIEV